jgi:hypothetical protein
MSQFGNLQDEMLAFKDDVRELARAILCLTDALNADPTLVSIDYRAVIVPHIRRVAMDLLMRDERRPSRPTEDTV